MTDKPKHSELTGIHSIHWSLFAQIYCVPIDANETEIIAIAKADLGSNFEHCPNEYIADRLVGGVECPFNPERRHVIHFAGRYGFMAAERGHFWPLDDNDKHSIKAECKASAKDGTRDLWIGDGPFSTQLERTCTDY